MSKDKIFENLEKLRVFIFKPGGLLIVLLAVFSLGLWHFQKEAMAERDLVHACQEEKVFQEKEHLDQVKAVYEENTEKLIELNTENVKALGKIGNLMEKQNLYLKLLLEGKINEKDSLGDSGG